jgi:hypothetical protein
VTTASHVPLVRELRKGLSDFARLLSSVGPLAGCLPPRRESGSLGGSDWDSDMIYGPTLPGEAPFAHLTEPKRPPRAGSSEAQGGRLVAYPRPARPNT